MKNQTILLVAVCAFCFLFYRCNNSTANTPEPEDSAASNTNMYGGYPNQAEWGKHLATILACGDCHTPKKMTNMGPVDDSSLLFSGYSGQIPTPVLTAEQISKGVAATFDNTGWIGPWGNSYTANITPDSTGIVTWSEEQFINCIRKGLYKGIEGSRPLMPPMPVPSYRNMTDNELKALFGYLKTIKPVRNIVPPYQPPATAAK